MLDPSCQKLCEGIRLILMHCGGHSVLLVKSCRYESEALAIIVGVCALLKYLFKPCDYLESH